MKPVLTKGEHFYIAFVDGLAVLDSRSKPCTFKSRALFERHHPDIASKAELVEYGPVSESEKLLT